MPRTEEAVEKKKAAGRWRFAAARVFAWRISRIACRGVPSIAGNAGGADYKCGRRKAMGGEGQTYIEGRGRKRTGGDGVGGFDGGEG